MHRDLARLASTLLVVFATSTIAASPTEPCNEISRLYANSNSSTGYTFNVPGQLAQDCLSSMPFHSDLAVEFIDEYTKYAQFQSTIEVLRSPPAAYLSYPVDLLGGLAGIRNRAKSNYYKSQYQFDTDLYNLLSSANDGHLSVSLCSIDGVTVPMIYTSQDAVNLAKGNNSVYPISLINGVGPAAILENLSGGQGFQDPDARYNAMVSNVPIDGQGNSLQGAFPLDGQWPGVDSFNFTLENGQVVQSPVQAQLATAFGVFDMADGKALFEKVCVPKASGSSSKSLAKARRSTTAPGPAPGPPENYPTPILREPYNTVVGYYPEDAGLTDVAVLSVPTFETTGDSLPDSTFIDFATTSEWFVQNATADGKKKIIIDLTNNGGGTVDSGFALLSVFFPNQTIYSGTRFRAHEAMDLIGRLFNAGDNSQNEVVNSSGLYIPDVVKPNQKTTFSSWKDLFGPNDVFGIPSSALTAEIKFADEANPISNPINIDGLGGDLDSRTPPFAPENILIVTDGRCSSTCTIFTDHMVAKGVRTVAMGGRPRPGPMQAIGGVKGSQVLSLDGPGGIASAAYEARELAASTSSKEDQDRFDEVMPIPLENFSLPLSAGSVNFRNTFTQQNDQVPTQFIYESANCHLFYTPETVIKPDIIWALAANATWGDGKCVGGVPKLPNISMTKSATENPGEDSTTSQNKAKPGTRKVLGLLFALGAGMD